MSAVRVVVLGAGSWGTALAALAARQTNTLLWARDPALADAVSSTYHNPRYLPKLRLPDALTATSNLQAALEHIRPSSHDAPDGLIILGVPVVGLAGVCGRLSQVLQGFPCERLSLIWTCKGLEQETGHLPHQVVQNHLQQYIDQGLGVGVLSGPSFADEVARGLPVALTVATTDAATAERTTQALHGDTARIYSSTDIIGVEIGGALKNIIAIACGISDGLGLGNNARAALITRGLTEIQRLGVALGGLAPTFFGLTGLGDLVLTATSSQSRNRQVGLAIGKGQALDTVLATGITAEGVRCVGAALSLGREHGVELPITRAVHDVLFFGLAPQAAVKGLLRRDAKPEANHLD